MVVGAEHSDTLISVNNLGLLLQERGQLDEAEKLLRHALEAGEKLTLVLEAADVAVD